MKWGQAQLFSLEPDIDSTLNQHLLANHINPLIILTLESQI